MLFYSKRSDFRTLILHTPISEVIRHSNIITYFLQLFVVSSVSSDDERTDTRYVRSKFNFDLVCWVFYVMSAQQSSRIFTQELLNEPKVDHVERFGNSASLSSPQLITTNFKLGNERFKHITVLNMCSYVLVSQIH